MSASVALILDTRPPTLRVQAPRAVEPPDVLAIQVDADEELGVVSVALLDAMGRLFNLGYERVTGQSLLVQVPTTGLASGSASLRVSAADDVLNFAQAQVEVLVRRPRAYDVELSLTHAHEVAFTRDGAYEVTETLSRAYSATLEVS